MNRHVFKAMTIKQSSCVVFLEDHFQTIQFISKHALNGNEVQL